MSKALTFTAVAGSALVAYAVYFDYKRRSSPDFRKTLKKKSVKQQKLAAKEHENTEEIQVRRHQEGFDC